MSSGEGREVSTTRYQRRPRYDGHFKFQSIPVHVEHRVKVGLAIEAGERVCQTPRFGIIPAWIVQLRAVPGDVRQTALVHLSLEEPAGTSGTDRAG